MLIYSPRYQVNLGKHVFPVKKYGLVYKWLTEEEKVSLSLFLEPEPVSDQEALSVHTYTYLEDLAHLIPSERTARSELPLSKEIIQGARMGVGGTVLAALEAIRTGWAANLGGGFHHAYPDHAEGFCYFNDVAIAAKVMIEEKRVERVLICDLDLHQGNGTARIFKEYPEVFTFSMHQDRLYPPKETSDLDIPLENGTGDNDYLALLQKHLPAVLDQHQPQLVIYLAGADPYSGDQLGSLALTKDGLRQRDRFVINQTRKRGIPLAVVLAGGYATEVMDTVEIHVNTILELLGWGETER